MFIYRQLPPTEHESVIARTSRQLLARYVREDQPLTLRMQPGYDHSYFFMASFMEDHLRWHAERLK